MTSANAYVLKGRTGGGGGAGVPAVLEVTTTSGPNDGEEQQVHRRSGTRAFRCAPLVRILGRPGHRRVVVGQVRLWRAVGAPLHLSVAVQSVWSEQPDGGWLETPSDEVHVDDLRPALVSPRHVVPEAGEPLEERQAVVSVVAKAIAEGSRDEATALRQLRYELEQRLTSVVRTPQGPPDSEVLADLLELGIVVGRARDQVREAAREGLWCWLGDDEAHQRHRRSLDHTVLNGVEPATARTRTWMRTHDAGVRQCSSAHVLLGEEAEVLARVLAGASTVVVAREAEAQQRFNAGVTLAGLGLGLPALVLTLYGADRLVPVRGGRQFLALLPVALAAGITAFIAGARLARGDASRFWYRHPWPALLAVVLLLALLLGAAVLAPLPPDS